MFLLFAFRYYYLLLLVVLNNWYQMTINPAKFEVARFDGTGNFGLWQRRVKDLLAQQSLQKALRETKPADMDDTD